MPDGKEILQQEWRTERQGWNPEWVDVPRYIPTKAEIATRERE